MYEAFGHDFCLFATIGALFCLGVHECDVYANE
jgi:hypothetical protein